MSHWRCCCCCCCCCGCRWWRYQWRRWRQRRPKTALSWCWGNGVAHHSSTHHHPLLPCCPRLHLQTPPPGMVVCGVDDGRVVAVDGGATEPYAPDRPHPSPTHTPHRARCCGGVGGGLSFSSPPLHHHHHTLPHSRSHQTRDQFSDPVFGDSGTLL